MIRVLIYLAIGVLCSACEKDEAVPVAEKKRITHLEYVLDGPSSSEPITLTFSDPDGAGESEPTITGGTLQSNTVYFGALQLSDQLATPAGDINTEINAEPSDYQFFFNPMGVDLDIIYADQDENGLPVGLFSAVRTSGPSEGTLILRLVRGLDKRAEGVSLGNENNAGGSTQLQVIFPISVE